MTKRSVSPAGNIPNMPPWRASIIRQGYSGAAFDQAAGDLEGLARPLWGLAPAQAGGV